MADAASRHAISFLSVATTSELLSRMPTGETLDDAVLVSSDDESDDDFSDSQSSTSSLPSLNELWQRGAQKLALGSTDTCHVNATTVSKHEEGDEGLEKGAKPNDESEETSQEDMPGLGHGNQDGKEGTVATHSFLSQHSPPRDPSVVNEGSDTDEDGPAEPRGAKSQQPAAPRCGIDGTGSEDGHNGNKLGLAEKPRNGLNNDNDIVMMLGEPGSQDEAVVDAAAQQLLQPPFEDASDTLTPRLEGQSPPGSHRNTPPSTQLQEVVDQQSTPVSDSYGEGDGACKGPPEAKRKLRPRPAALHQVFRSASEPSLASDDDRADEVEDTNDDDYTRRPQRKRRKNRSGLKASSKGHNRSNGTRKCSGQHNLSTPPSSKGNSDEEYATGTPTAAFEEWPLQDAVLKRVTEGGQMTFQFLGDQPSAFSMKRGMLSAADSDAGDFMQDDDEVQDGDEEYVVEQIRASRSGPTDSPSLAIKALSSASNGATLQD
ncbi:hypothetical protein TruAng_003770 [Truncatella angustata]|nr:hypothetical protein TruAng_003770 [Truncatella angustata]